jgi:hypothetical protein
MSQCAFAVEMLGPSFIKSMEKDLKLQNTVNLCVHQFDATRSAIAELLNFRTDSAESGTKEPWITVASQQKRI